MAFVLFIPLFVLPSLAESQTMPTEKGTLDVKLTHDAIEPNIQTKINIDFINPFTQKVQEHIDYTISVSKDGKTVFGPIPLTHTSVGSVKIPIEFNLGEGVYTMDFEIEGILFQPIPTETVSFDIIVGDIAVEDTVTSKSKIPDWVKNIFVWYGQDQVSEDELLNAIKYLINEEIIKLD